MIQIKAVDAQNVGEVCRLAAGQNCLGPARGCSPRCNALSIAEASYRGDMHPNAIYHNHRLIGFFLYQRPESHADTATLCRFMVDGRFRQEGLEETALEHILRGLKIQGVKQVEAHLEPGDGRAEALLLACGFRLAEENTHTARYTCRFETQNWR